MSNHFHLVVETPQGNLVEGMRWLFSTEAFKREALARMEGQLGEQHAGELRRRTSEAKAERIIGDELKQLGWTEADLERRHKSDPGKLALAARLRRETTLPMKWMARRLHLGMWKSAGTNLNTWRRSQEERANSENVAI
jgi:hypothetical protein